MDNKCTALLLSSLAIIWTVLAEPTDGTISAKQVCWGEIQALLARIESVSLVDDDGTSLPSKTDITNKGVLIKQTIRTTHVIRTLLSEFPKTFEQLRDPGKGTPTDLCKERKKIGQEWIFGLKDPELHGTISIFHSEKRILTEKKLELALKQLLVM